MPGDRTGERMRRRGARGGAAIAPASGSLAEPARATDSGDQVAGRVPALIGRPGHAIERVGEGSARGQTRVVGLPGRYHDIDEGLVADPGATQVKHGVDARIEHA